MRPRVLLVPLLVAALSVPAVLHAAARPSAVSPSSTPEPVVLATDATHRVSMAFESSASAAPVVVLRVESAGSAKVKPETPLSLQLAGRDGLQLAKPRFDKVDFQYDTHGATLRMPTTLAPGGARPGVDGSLSFFVCTADACNRKVVDVHADLPRKGL